MASQLTRPRQAREALRPSRPWLRSAIAPALFVTLALLLFAPAIVGGKVLSPGDVTRFSAPFQHPGLDRPSNDALSDAAWVFEPDQLEVRDALRSLRLPLWTPHQSAGRPLLAAQQSAPLFPLNWLGTVFPYWGSLAWVALLKLALAGLGTFLLCRALGNGRAPSLVGGLAFGFGTYLISWLDHPHTNAYILLPWLFLAGWRLCRKGRPIDAAALGGVTGLVFLGGHPQSAMIVSLPTVAWVTYRLFAEDLSASPVKRRAALAIGAGGLGLALGSVMLLPFVEALRNSYEASRGGPALDVQAGISFLFPDYWNRPDRSYVVGGPANFSERTAYFGALPILLAVGGLAARRPRGPEAFFALLALVALAVAFDSGPITEAVRSLPLLSSAQLNRTLVLVAFSGSVLAAYGLQRLLTGTVRERRRIVLAAAALALVPALGWLAVHLGDLSLVDDVTGAIAGSSGHLTEQTAPLAAVLRWLVFGTLALALLAAIAVRRGRWVAPLAVGLVALDLWTMAWGYHPMVEKSQAVPPETPAIAEMRRLTATDGRTAADEYALGPNTPSRFGLRDARGWELPVIERHQRLWTALGGQGFQRTLLDPTVPEAPKLLDVFGVRAVLSSGLAERGYPVEYTGPDGVVLGNPTALPRAFVAYRWRESPSVEGSVSLIAAGTSAEARELPVLEGAGPAPPTPTFPSTPARVRDDSDTSVTVSFTARAPGQLVLNDTFYPGWTAELDGREVPIRPANAAFRAVAVPAGRHEVRFVYRPASAYVGAGLSLAALLGLIGLALTAPLARRRSRR